MYNVNMANIRATWTQPVGRIARLASEDGRCFVHHGRVYPLAGDKKLHHYASPEIKNLLALYNAAIDERPDHDLWLLVAGRQFWVPAWWSMANWMGAMQW